MKKLVIVTAGLLLGAFCHAMMLDNFLDGLKVRDKFEKLSPEKQTQVQNLFIELRDLLSEIRCVVESKSIEVKHKDALAIIQEWLGTSKLTLTLSIGEAPATSENK
jgi:hypothetical protein